MSLTRLKEHKTYDSRHRVTRSIGTRSRGFVWFFFSFLAWYSKLKKDANSLILLLDEPGLSLHAKAQEDLLRYFEKEVKEVHQLIYTNILPIHRLWWTPLISKELG